MKLSELFPDMPDVLLNGVEYEIIFNTRAMLQLEHDYPDYVINDKEITSQERIANALNSGVTGMKTIDVVNLLYAGLVHTKTFTKEALIDAMQPCYFPVYIDHILTAYQLSKSTPEQIEKMEVMAQASKSKKKMGQEITEANMPTIESNVD